MGAQPIRTGILLGLGCVLAGVGPSMVSGPAMQRICLAAAFSIPAVAPFFFATREVGLAAGVVAATIVTVSVLVGVFGLGTRFDVARTLQLASAGAVTGTLACSIAWVREMARTEG